MTKYSRRSTRRGRVWRWVGTTFSIVLIVAGAAAVTFTVAAPQESERLSGEVVIAAHQVADAVTGAPSTVSLGAEGTPRTLDRCDGTFTRILAYEETSGVLPTWAAHNGCDGDVILPLQLGDTLMIEGGDAPGLYEVVDSRQTAKQWAAVSELEGMHGDFVLQTCFYGRPHMLFLGVERVADASTAADGDKRQSD